MPRGIVGGGASGVGSGRNVRWGASMSSSVGLAVVELPIAEAGSNEVTRICTPYNDGGLVDWAAIVVPKEDTPLRSIVQYQHGDVRITRERE